MFYTLIRLFPPQNQFEYRVVVSTCWTSGALRGAGMGSAFDMVIVDEACQATEAEVCVL